MEGDPKFPGTQWLPNFDYAAYAELCGLKGIFCDDGDQVRSALGRGARRRPPRSCSRSRPTPRSRRCPRTSRVEQAKKMAEAMVKGDPERTGVMEKSLRGQARRVHRAPEVVVTAGSTASSGSKSTRTRSRPTSRSRTGRSSGTRRRSSSSRRTPAEDGPRLHVLRRGRRRSGLLPARRRCRGRGRDGRARRLAAHDARRSATRASRGSASAPCPRSTRRCGT